MLLRLVPRRLHTSQALGRFSTLRSQQVTGLSATTLEVPHRNRAEVEAIVQRSLLLNDSSSPLRHSLPVDFRAVAGQQILLICPFASSTAVAGQDAVLPGWNISPLHMPTTAESELEHRCPGQSSEVLDDPGDASKVSVEIPCVSESANIARECVGARRRARKSQGLFERWWLEYDPKKANYISGKGRGPHGGNSIRKGDWPQQMVPIRFKKRWEQREKMRFAFRKHGFEYDVPKWGG